ncbi:thiazole biosynthesis protein ThiJ [Clostridia bacterium]|nr:thiazole biosynthesis protein ThiJ [Clostridia bacterium]
MIYLHLTEGFEETEAITVVDLLRRADISIQTVSMMKDLTVTGSHEIPVIADTLFEDVNYDNCEMIILPGGGPGVQRLFEHKGLSAALKEAAQGGKFIAAICAAPKVLAENGLLEGKKATIYPSMESDLGNAVYKKEKVVQDGNIITSMGPGTSVDFALKLVEVLVGAEASQKVREAILWDR